MKGNIANTGNCYSLKFKMQMEYPYKKIAEELGVSYQYVQQIETMALTKFKKKFCEMFPDTWKLIENDILRGYF